MHNLDHKQAERLMNRAVSLAVRQRQTAPNPRVAALVVRDGRVVGVGAHQSAGAHHSEILALQDAGADAQGAEMIVTLEPCNHTGRTGPCSKAVYDAGIRKVWVGSMDPNPQGAGGADWLRDQGIEVETGILQDKTDRLLDDFGCWLAGQPWGILKSAMTLDGQIADLYGASQWITGEAARKRGHQLRAAVDAILIGKGTMLTDKPSLTLRHGVRGAQPQRIVLCRSLPEADAPIHMDPADGAILFVTEQASGTEVEAWAKRSVEVVILSGWIENPDSLQKWLFARGIYRFLVEGGAFVSRWMLNQQLVHQAHLFVAPKLLGGTGTPIFQGPTKRQIHASFELADMKSRKVGNDIEISGRIVYPKD